MMMASSSRTSSSLLAHVSRITSNASASSTAILAVRSLPLLHRSFVLLASRRSAFPHPRLPFPSELFLPRAFSTSPHISSSLATASSEATPAADAIIDSRVHFETLRGQIHDDTLKAITVHPFKHTHLSPVQEQILPLLPHLAVPHHRIPSESLERARDLLVKAKTGTGKTMAFLVPAIEARLQAISAHVSDSLATLAATGVKTTPADRSHALSKFTTEQVGTLIISPTRELATQIAVEASNLTSHHRGFQVQVLLGGESKYRQMRAWKGRKDVVVATPGRLLDLLQTQDEVREAIAHTKLLVLDEADTLLDMGFREDIERLTSYLPPAPQRQTFLFSATVSRAIEQIAQKTLSRSHRFVNCVSKDDSPVHAHIPQYHTVLPSGEDAFPHLLRLIAHDQLTKPHSKVIVFFSTTKMVQLYADLLRETAHALPAGRKTSIYEMHAKRDMSKRIQVSDAFRRDKSAASVLVSSDVSARGVDYPGVTRVIQMGLPASTDMYVHRVGRTGRAGKDGRGDLVISPWELPFISRKMRQVGLKPVTVADVKKEVEELAKASSTASTTSLPHLTSLDTLALSTMSSLPSEDLTDVYMAQLGFYLGRLDPLGLSQSDVITGLGKFFQDMAALDRPPMMSRSMESRLVGGGGRSRGGSMSRSGGGGYGESRGGYGASRGGYEGRSRSTGGGFERSSGGGGYEGRNRSGGGGFERSSGGGGYGASRGSFGGEDKDRGAGNRRAAWGTYATGSEGRGLGRGEHQKSSWESTSREKSSYGGFERKGRGESGGYGGRGGGYGGRNESSRGGGRSGGGGGYSKPSFLSDD